ncbi:hypothetical protein AMK13_36575 [Streptomyces sp. CB02056]|nr:hypothetical protein AMK13_36575 [Streptomyces sp. CB02056]
MAGTGPVSGALLSGTVPPDSPLVRPLVVLALGSVAYDLGVRARRRRNGWRRDPMSQRLARAAADGLQRGPQGRHITRG